MVVWAEVREEGVKEVVKGRARFRLLILAFEGVILRTSVFLSGVDDSDKDGFKERMDAAGDDGTVAG